MVKSFKDLIVWQKSFELVTIVYESTANLPTIEKYGLVDQMRRSSVSIPSNIAEGSKRGTKKDYVQFLRIAHGSSAELETQLLLTKRLYNTDIDTILNKLIEVQKMLSGLINSLTKT